MTELWPTPPDACHVWMELNLVDCVSFEFMRAQGLREVLALVADFAAAGYRLLPTSAR